VPSSVTKLLSAGGLEPSGVVPWGALVPVASSGVYVVALHDSADVTDGLSVAPISSARITELLAVRPELRLRGKRPSAEELRDLIAAFWLGNEPVLYVGLATSLRTRVSAYYRTPLGAKRPHSGGWFLKMLEPERLNGLFVHYAFCSTPAVAEQAMLRAFLEGVSKITRERLADPTHPFPFANLEHPAGVRKDHGLTGTRGDLSPTA